MKILNNLKNVKKLSSNEIDFIYYVMNELAHNKINLNTLSENNQTEYDFKNLAWQSIAENIADKLA